MSQENVEIVRAAMDAANRGDLDAATKAMAPDCECDMSRSVGFTGTGVYTVDEWRRRLEEFLQLWESVRFEVDEFIDAGITS